jgi:hypothetical protein
MKSLSRRLAPLCLVAVAQLLVNCAPERARAVREDKSLTLGLPGVTYRPHGKIGVGVTMAGISEAKTKIDTQDSGIKSSIVSSDDKSDHPDAIRDVKQSNVDVNPYVQFFPFDTSAFFIGLQGTYQRAWYEFEEERSDSTSLAPTYTDVKYRTKSNYLGVQAGWAWIWESGFSMGVQAGPRVRVSHQGEYANEGDDVNTDKRDKTVETIDSLEQGVRLSTGLGIIGWSF